MELSQEELDLISKSQQLVKLCEEIYGLREWLNPPSVIYLDKTRTESLKFRNAIFDHIGSKKLRERLDSLD